MEGCFPVLVSVQTGTSGRRYFWTGAACVLSPVSCISWSVTLGRRDPNSRHTCLPPRCSPRTVLDPVLSLVQGYLTVRSWTKESTRYSNSFTSVMSLCEKACCFLKWNFKPYLITPLQWTECLSPFNSYVEILPRPQVMVLGGGALGRWNEVMRVGLPRVGLVPWLVPPPYASPVWGYDGKVSSLPPRKGFFPEADRAGSISSDCLASRTMRHQVCCLYATWSRSLCYSSLKWLRLPVKPTLNQ